MNALCGKRRARGFSLIEVMVSLIIIAVGLLGVAKMQALALSSTGVSTMRSLAAIQAASFAAAMKANRAYWSAASAAQTTVVSGTGVASSTDAQLTAAPGCATGNAVEPAVACTAAEMAAFDAQSWAVALNSVLPNYTGTVVCGTLVFPVTCTITLTWSENTVAVNTQETGNVMQAAPYELFVQP